VSSNFFILLLFRDYEPSGGSSMGDSFLSMNLEMEAKSSTVMPRKIGYRMPKDNLGKLQFLP
jgi:hypothetical protein